MAVTITFSIPGTDAPKFKKRIQDESLKRGLSVSEFLVEAVAEFLRSENGRI